MRYTIACKRCHFRAHTTTLFSLGSELHAHAAGGCDDEPSIVPEEEDSSKLECNRKSGLDSGFVTTEGSTSRSLRP
jgi:hypothetical protein